MKNLSLSVIVPVYNMEKYLGVCIDSLLAQTYDNLHVVLVNDCSSDNSLGILQNYEKKYPDKIMVIDSKENLRQGGARNLGIRASRSDYIGFVDADDFVHPKMYEILMGEAEMEGVDAVYCGHNEFDEADTQKMLAEESDCRELSKVSSTKLSDEDRMELMVSHQYGSVWGGVYRRSLIEENHLYFPERLAYEDNFWVYALQMHLESVTVVQKRLYYYRQHIESTVHRKNSMHQYDRIEISKRFLAYVKENKLIQRYHKIVEYIFIEVFTHNTYSILVRSFEQPKVEKLGQVKRLLKGEFPKWRKNPFYREKFSAKQKLKMNLIVLLPAKWYICLQKHIEQMRRRRVYKPYLWR